LLSLAVQHPALESLKRLEHEYSLREELNPAWAASPMAMAREPPPFLKLNGTTRRRCCMGKSARKRRYPCCLGWGIVDAPSIPNLFAFIDNVRQRNPSAALQTAGFDGLSPLISQTIQMSVNFEAGAYTCLKKKSGRYGWLRFKCSSMHNSIPWPGERPI
jgi:hypothetical protein